jgi:hypothetical protein
MKRNSVMSYKLASIIMLAAVVAAPPAMANESQFLASLGGSWKGTGTVRMRTNASPVKVTCTFQSNPAGQSLRMEGTCRGLVVVKREISADLAASGNSYKGNYVGPSGRPSALSGKRQGDAINLTVRWNREINGDRVANMTISKVGNNGLRLRTTDKDGANGKNVVTSDIQLTR